MDHKYIVIEGNIGAGKTSLARHLSSDYNAKLILEQFSDNPFLPKFYKDPDRYSFPLELSFLAARYHQLREEMSNRDLFHPFIVSDYYFMKSLIFAGRTLKDDEYNLYRQLFLIIYESLPKPDLYVYLYVDTERLLDNIKLRGRSYEQEISAGYLNDIQKGYFEFFRQNPTIPYLILDVNQLDFVNRVSDYLLIKEALFNKQYPVGMTRIVLKHE